MEKRVQRIFEHLRPDQPPMRANLLIYGMPALWNSRREWDRHLPATGAERFLRVERQCLVKLPLTGTVVFSIHTLMVRPGALTAAQRQAPAAARRDLPETFWAGPAGRG